MSLTDDPYPNPKSDTTAPGIGVFSITPSDDNALPFVARFLNVAVAGNVRIIDYDGDTATVNIAAGTVFWVMARKVFATGTTATGIVGIK